MPFWNFDFYDRKPLREAKDGIKARSQRGKIGESWWSERFIKVLESFDIGARLGRGRSYARKGQVMDFEINPGIVTSKVQGTSPRPYKIRIEIEPLSEKDWGRAEEAMASQALFMAKLLAGEMPREIEEAFTQCNLSLFPQYTRDLKTDCSCPDWSNPCKHIAATYYIMAERFDEDPFLIFKWRGRTKEHLIGQLRELRGTDSPEEETEAEAVELTLAEEVPPLADCLKDFWGTDTDLSGLRIMPEPAEIPDALLRQLGPAPLEVTGKNLADLLTPAYSRMTRGAAARAFKER